MRPGLSAGGQRLPGPPGAGDRRRRLGLAQHPDGRGRPLRPPCPGPGHLGHLACLHGQLPRLRLCHRGLAGDAGGHAPAGRHAVRQARRVAPGNRDGGGGAEPGHGRRSRPGRLGGLRPHPASVEQDPQSPAGPRADRGVLVRGHRADRFCQDRDGAAGGVDRFRAGGRDGPDAAAGPEVAGLGAARRGHGHGDSGGPPGGGPRVGRPLERPVAGDRAGAGGRRAGAGPGRRSSASTRSATGTCWRATASRPPPRPL